MGSKIIRNASKIWRVASGRILGRLTAGTGRAEELTDVQTRTWLDVPTNSDLITGLAGKANSVHGHIQSDVTGLVAALTAKADLVGGVVPSAQIPAIAITEYLGSVANQAAMLALVGDRGDWCLRSDTGTTWVLADDDSTQLSSWIELSYPTSPVTSVNGETGAVTLSAADIGAVAKAGDTMTGSLILPASAAGLVPLVLTQGTTPAAAADGSLWITSSGVYAAYGGTAGFHLAALNAAQVWGNHQKFKTSDASSASIEIPHGVDPTVPDNGDIWSKTTGFFCFVDGVTKQFAMISDLPSAGLTQPQVLARGLGC